MLNRGGELLTWTGDNVGWGGERALSGAPESMSSEAETESEDSGEYSSIPLAEVAEVSRSSPVARCQGWTRLAPEMLKAQDILGLSWLFWNSIFRVADWDGGSHLNESGPDGVGHVSLPNLSTCVLWSSRRAMTGS